MHCAKCNSKDCKYVDLCDKKQSESSESSDNESKMLNIFDEVAGDNSFQDQMYEFDAKEADCAEWNDLASDRKLYENIVNTRQEENQTEDQHGAGEISTTNPVEMPPNEMIELNSEMAGDSIMSQLQNIVENSSNPTKTDAVQFEPKPNRIQWSDSAIHIKRRLIIEEISVKKCNENPLPEADGATESQDFEPVLETLLSSNSELLEISFKDPETSVEIQSNFEYIPETVFKQENIQYIQATVDVVSSKEFTTENLAYIEEIPLSEDEPVEALNETDDVHTVELVVDDHESQSNSNNTSQSLPYSVSNSSDNESIYIATIHALTEDYPDSPKSIHVASKYQELKTLDQNIDEHFNITCLRSSIDEICTSDESESDENNPEMIESPDTMQKFLSKYNIFLENMGSRLNHLREMTDQLGESRAHIDEELTQLGISRPTTTESTAEDVEEILYAENSECIDLTNRSDLIDRLLVTKSPLFDLSAEDVNRQVDALRDNNFNSTAEMIERVYCQRDRYTLGLENDEEISTKDYYETFGNFVDDDKAEAINGESFNMEEIAEIERPEALHYLLDFEEAQMKERENGGRLTIYCENVDKLVVEDSRFTPDLLFVGNIRGVIAEEEVPEELFESSEGYGEISIDR